MGGFGSGRFGRRSPRARIEETPSVTVRDLRGLRDPVPFETVVLSLAPSGVPTRVRITSTPQTFGGWRSWLVCPRCGKKCVRLYIRPASFRPIACRRCHQLRYVSQCLSMSERWHHRAHRLYRRAGCSMNDVFHYRPKYMRESTFNRLIDRAIEFDQAWMGYGLWRILGNKG